MGITVTVEQNITLPLKGGEILKTFFKAFLFMVCFVSSLLIFSLESQAASSPYDVESSVRSGWDSIYGGKTYNGRSGKYFVYDVYYNKYFSGGYRIINKDFGKGSQPYINFRGWAVLFGHKRHTTSNQETYIVAQNISTGTEKVYGTLQVDIDATEDLEYNNQGSGVWNECSAGATNQDNELDCNMRYEGVGFDAYLPIEELFPDETDYSKWRLYIVKRVDSHIVYTRLILPFEFDTVSHNNGTVTLDSGLNASRLKMIGEGVIRRPSPRCTAAACPGYEYGYFTYTANYTRNGQNESGTSIWYSVSSPADGGATRWATTAYWDFGGDQAIIAFDPPPVHVSDGIPSGYRYQSGNNYWVQPNDTIYVRLRQKDLGSGNRNQYIRIVGSGAEARSVHEYSEADGHNNQFNTDSNVAIRTADEEEYTGTYGTVKWGVTPKTHGHSYAIQYYYMDKARGNVGYNSINEVIKVDGVEPQHISDGLTGADYVSGANYWVQPNTTVKVSLRQYDPHSGNKLNYFRLYGSGVDVRSVHNFNNGIYDMNDFMTNSNVVVNSATRTEDTSYGTVVYSVTPKTHGHVYDLQHYYGDNAGNTFTDYVSTGMKLGVDSVGPSIAFRNSADTANFTSRNWDDTSIIVRLKFSDAHSGYKQSRYAWTQSATTPTSWSAWSTDSDYNVSKASKGQWYLHVQAQDNVGNITTTNEGVYKFNNPPIANFTYSPTTIYNDTTVKFTNASSDPDGDALTYQWAYQTPGSSTWVNFSTAEDPTRVLNIKGTWDIRLTVTDTSGQTASVIKSPVVVNRPPVANFSFSPATIYNDTTVTFTNLSTDADKDTLTYQWSYQQPGSTTWTNFSTSEDTSRVLNIKGTWAIRLTVTDESGAKSAEIKYPTVVNRPPVANFTFSPTTIYNDTTVTFTNSSTDADKDVLTYQWAYQQPGTTTWTNFSTAKDPTKILNVKGTWGIRLIVTDESGATATLIKNPIVLNRAPIVTISYTPTDPYEGDTIKVCVSPTDADKDLLTVKIFISKDGGTEQNVFTNQNVTSGVQQCYSFVSEVGRYDLKTTVNDGMDTTTVSTWFYSKALIINGYVKHTPLWQEKHNSLGHAPNQFYSGEKFLLEADTSPYPTVYVKSTLSATRANETPVSAATTLIKKTNIFFTGELFDPTYLEYPTNLKTGPAAFEFEVKYTNGVIKKAIVPIEIISDSFDAYQLHRKR